jgi:hypothetical protein
MPLLASLDKLSTHGYLDELLSMRNGEFADKLLVGLSEEVNGCTDVKRLLAIVGVALNLLQPDFETIDSVRSLMLRIPSFKPPVGLSGFVFTTFSLYPAAAKGVSIHDGNAGKSLPPSASIHSRTTFCQAVRRWRNNVYQPSAPRRSQQSSVEYRLARRT